MAKHKDASSSKRWTFSRPEQRIQWSYNKWYSAHIKRRTRYLYVREHWDRQIAELRELVRLQVEERDPVAVRLDDGDRDVFRRAGAAGVKTLMAFLDRVATQEQAAAFCQSAGISPEDLVSLLRKIYKYLPFGAQMRLLVAEDDPVAAYLGHLKAHTLGHSLALLEAGCTQEGRAQLAKEAGIPDNVLLDLVRRADLTRLRLMSGGMIRQAWALGYKGLAALQKADPEEYYARCVAYYDEAGKGMPFDLTWQAVASHLARMRQAVRFVEE